MRADLLEEVTAMRRQGPSTRCRVRDTARHRELHVLIDAAGVMRFLQLEWHSHERARNAWDIERAEMKAKIAKQEGEVRSAKKLNDQLNRHVQMLEQALKNERNKSKAGANAQAAADEKKDKARAEAKSGMGPVKRAQTLSLVLLLPLVHADMLLLQLKPSPTTRSSMSTRSPQNTPKPSETASARSRRCILRDALRRSPIC
jgi:hypothetical protein